MVVSPPAVFFKIPGDGTRVATSSGKQEEAEAPREHVTYMGNEENWTSRRQQLANAWVQRDKLWPLMLGFVETRRCITDFLVPRSCTRSSMLLPRPLDASDVDRNRVGLRVRRSGSVAFSSSNAFRSSCSSLMTI
jgi:hypothetical protein